MNMTREIYWNVGHGVVLPMYLLVIGAVCFMCWQWWKRFDFYRQGKALDRSDRKGERIRRLLRESIGQMRVHRVRDGGFPTRFFSGHF